MGDDSPDPTAVFQRTFCLGSNSTGGLPSPIPEEFGPLNCGHSAAPEKFDRMTAATTTIQEAFVMRLPLSRHDCTEPTAHRARCRCSDGPSIRPSQALLKMAR